MLKQQRLSSSIKIRIQRFNIFAFRHFSSSNHCLRMISPHNRQNHRNNRHGRDDDKKNEEDSKNPNPPGHVLLLTILDAMYPITTKLLEVYHYKMILTGGSA